MPRPSHEHEQEAIRRGLRVSTASAAWTLLSGGSSIAAGVLSGSLVLVAFGAVGLMDALGSFSLIVHFRHALRQQNLSERKEIWALRLVRFGMAAVGAGTLGDSAFRLSSHSTANSSPFGVMLAGVSLLVLILLASAKLRIAPRVPSRALRADGWLSGIGALLAGVTLIGSGLQATLGWWWLDSTAAAVVGATALGLSLAAGRG